MLQELKGTEFPAGVFQQIGYESAAVTQKAYNGVAVLSRYPIGTVSTTLTGDDADSHARYLEVTIEDIRIVNIYLPNGNPVGSDKFLYKLAWMDRLIQQMAFMAAAGSAGTGRWRLQCHPGGYRLPQAVVVDARRIVPAGAARAVPRPVDSGLYGCVSVAASRRGTAFYFLGLFSAGFRA